MCSTIENRRDRWVHFHILYYKVTLVLHVAKRMINGYTSLLVSCVHTVNGLFVCLELTPYLQTRCPWRSIRLMPAETNLTQCFKKYMSPDTHRTTDMRRDDKRGMDISSLKMCWPSDQKDKAELWMSDWLDSQHHLPDADFQAAVPQLRGTVRRFNSCLFSLASTSGRQQWNLCSRYIFTQLENGPYLIHLWPTA